MDIKGILFTTMSVVKDIFRWFYWYPFRFFVQRLSFNSIYDVGSFFGAVLYRLSYPRRKSLEMECKKLGIANPGAVVRNAFNILCQNEIEVLIFPLLNKDNIGSIVEYDGINYLNDALDKGRGAMLLFAHFGANQMIMPAVGYLGYKMCQLSAPPTVWIEKLHAKRFSAMSRRGLELRWMHELSLPVKHINVFSSMKEAFLCLKRNEVLGVAIDGGDGKRRLAVDFLGKKAFFSVGAMDIAMRTGCAALPVFMVRYKNGRHKMVIEAPLKIKTKEDSKDALTENIKAFVIRLEEYVMRYPCHYVNFIALRTFMENIDNIPFITDKEKTFAESITH